MSEEKTKSEFSIGTMVSSNGKDAQRKRTLANLLNCNSNIVGSGNRAGDGLIDLS
jgi:hypothetical protein